MKKLTVLLFYLIFSALIYPDENVRSSYILRLSVDESNYWEWTVPESPYIINENYIQLYPGETLFVEADIINNRILNFRIVNQIVDYNKTIIIKFNQITQNDNEKIHNLMMLEIKNPFNINMEYKADIFLIKYNRWIKTSTIPVRNGLSSFESWSDIIGTIVLYDFNIK